jgi:hypothetical protein
LIDEQVMKLDRMTSVSDVKLHGGGMADHSYRKVGNPRRRQYVDCPTCVPSLYNIEVAQIQTDPRKTSVVESQVIIQRRFARGWRIDNDSIAIRLT